MKLLLDEDCQRKRLVMLLGVAGHEVVTVGEIGLNPASDEAVLLRARDLQYVLITRNVRDFRALHDADPRHPGILAEYHDRDVSKNMSAGGIVRAIDNIDASGIPIDGQFVSLNAWAFTRSDAS